MKSCRLKRFEKILTSLIHEWFCYHNNINNIKSFDFTIEKIHISPDLRNAKIIISSTRYGDEILEKIQNALPFIQKYVSSQLQSKSVPKVRFTYDRTSSILKSLPKQDFEE